MGEKAVRALPSLRLVNQVTRQPPSPKHKWSGKGVQEAQAPTEMGGVSPVVTKSPGMGSPGVTSL